MPFHDFSFLQLAISLLGFPDAILLGDTKRHAWRLGSWHPRSRKFHLRSLEAEICASKRVFVYIIVYIHHIISYHII